MPPKENPKIMVDQSNLQNNLTWTDGEVQLLLEKVKDFKNKKAYEKGVDWVKHEEKACNKY